MESIEEKEIKGISAKTIITLLICTGSILLSVMGTYYGLKSDISDIRATNTSDARINELKLRVMDQRLDALEIQIKEMAVKQDERNHH